MKVSVIGCGRWGSFIAWYLNRIGHDVALYGRRTSETMKALLATRQNNVLTLPEEIELSTDLNEALQAEVIIISVNSQGLRALIGEISEFNLTDKIFVLCMKGLEIGTGKRLSEIVAESIDGSNSVAVWLGPGHVQEFHSGTPNCMVIDSTDESVKQKLIDEFSSDLIRFYYGRDLIGNEIGAAAKNIIGIAAGMLDALHLSSLKGALMSRGTREIARLIKALGGNELSAYGLCHLGDYEATVFSKYSHNRAYGEMLINGGEYAELAEGHYTVKAIMLLAEKNYVTLPICGSVYDIIYKHRDAKETLEELFSRSLKNEF